MINRFFSIKTTDNGQGTAGWLFLLLNGPFPPSFTGQHHQPIRSRQGLPTGYRKEELSLSQSSRSLYLSLYLFLSLSVSTVCPFLPLSPPLLISPSLLPLPLSLSGSVICHGCSSNTNGSTVALDWYSIMRSVTHWKRAPRDVCHWCVRTL